MTTLLVVLFCAAIVVAIEWDNLRTRDELSAADRKLAREQAANHSLRVERDKAVCELAELTEYTEQLELFLGPTLRNDDHLAAEHLAAELDDDDAIARWLA
jgi:hypothetical protein